MKRNIVTIVLLTMICLCIIACSNSHGFGQSSAESGTVVADISPDDADSEMIITALQVGKADSVLITQNDSVVLIDTGEYFDVPIIIDYIRSNGIERIDGLIITHFDKDHVGGAADIINEIPIKTLYLPDYDGNRPEYRQMLESLENKPQIQVQRVVENMSVSIGEMDLIIYPADKKKKLAKEADSFDNNMSLVTLVSFGKRSFLFTGDIETDRIERMLKKEKELKCDWIKIPHHGRYQKAVGRLIKAVSPQYAVVCTDTARTEDEKLEDILEELKIPLYSTKDGNVITKCDGDTITVYTEDAR